MSAPSVPSAPSGRVVALLVTHDGTRWLPGVLDGIAEQGPALSGVVAVDTGSTDGSRDLLPGGYDLVEATSSASYPDAVRLGLERVAALAPDTEWVWLLHDDSRPAPGALAALLAAAARRPDVDVLGPKLREWPSLRRLLELGVTLSGTGRRETGLERGEYDQGQHDEEREVLAVNSAGMLVRRRVLEELGGFDPRLPMFGNDLDLGWRAAAAGHATLVVPDAVVFHAEAAHRGLRRAALTGRHTHYQERRAALYTLLVNSSAAALPWRVLRLTLGTLVRMVGFLLVRSVGEALDDLAALVAVVLRPGQVRAGRRERRDRAAAGGPDRERVKRLLPPPWLPYRHGLDFVGDVVSAVTQQASDVAERRRVAAAELDPSSQAATRLRAERERDEDDDLADSGAIARFFTNPVALTMTLVVAVMVVAARTALGQVSGGALAPAPDGAGAWWSLHLASWHELGFGTDVPAPPYVLPLALLGTVLGPTGAVSLLLVGSAPFALWGAWRFLRVAGRLVSPRGAPRWILVGGATAYAVAPVAAGAWGHGRLGLVVAGALLPWLAHAALGFAEPEPDRRRRAGWRVGLLLALTTAFAPTTWLVAAVLVLVVLGAGLLLARGLVSARDVWLPPLTAILVPLVLLGPWWVPALSTGSGAAVLLDAGRPPSDGVGALDLLAGRLGDLGAPTWAGLAMVVLAVLALLPRATRIPVTLCWLVVLVSATVGAVLGTVDLTLTATDTPAGLGGPILAAQAGLVVAVVLGAQGATRAGLAGPLRAAGMVAAAAAVVVPLTGIAWWLTGDDDLTSADASVVPAYMVQRSTTGPEHGVLVVDGSVATGLTYTVRRGDGVTVGEDEVLAPSDVDPADAATVRDFLSRPTGDVVDRLGGLGIEYVLLTAPVDGTVAAALDATSGLVQAGSDAGTRAWEVDRPLDPDAVAGDDSGSRVVLRAVLLAVQGLGVVLVLVLAAPTLRARRRP
ncbi:glycosyltransferase family 2 protein [Nocardioides dongxiaopingii]|uniref:glycosyltransferase family 2 protein n=1 Tax=Nocardioides dongxiaopingii TaxID=2576036 RepID=UPI0010C76DF8|nr:glycosyltransferase family 2 protein [Nocardioides dongxiaopingii]